MARMKLGEVLVQAGAIDELQLRAGLAEQRKWGKPLGRTLIEMKVIDENTLVAALTRQSGIPNVDLDAITVEPAALAFLTHRLCVDNGCLPFRHTARGNFLDVAMSDPTNPQVFDRIRVATRCNIRPYLAGPFAIDKAIRKHYLGQAVDPSIGQDNRPWQQGRAGEMLFDERGQITVRTGEHQLEDLELEVSRVGTADHQAPMPPTRMLESASEDHGHPEIAADLERVLEEVSRLTALLERDEKVIRKLMALLVEKGLCTKEELLARISKE